MKEKARQIIVAVVCTAVAFCLIAVGVYTAILRGVQLNDEASAAALKDDYPSPVKYINVEPTDGVRLSTVTSGKYFYTLHDGKWEATFLKGVNMGLTMPTTDLSNPDITYETYMGWFSLISTMNANTIKVFTIMNPDFYRALYDYNKKNAKNPIYILQGIWFNENDMYDVGDAYGWDGKILKQLEKASKEVTDIINGNSDYTSYGKIKKAIYDKDVSDYVAGYIMGLEWSPDFVLNTNKNNPTKAEYKGQYLYTKDASPFEAFLCEAGNYAIEYETETYGKQRPVAFLNWSTTDPLKHSNEPFPEEDAVSVDTEHILASDSYQAGLFAAIDLYPYYPEFLNYQPEYIKYKDPQGRRNPYRAYLKDLQTHYTVPVIAAEFGIPTSRGVAHESVMGYNQGGIDEISQGKDIIYMLSDIAKEQFAGAMVFSWQDEWFKQTWNTVKYAPAKASQRTLNVQSPEQRYGIIAYEPGAVEAACYPDGDIGEWGGQSSVFSADGIELLTKYDEGYFYICGKMRANFDFEKDKLAIALSTTGRGNESALGYGLSFDKPADFLVMIDGRDNTRILSDAYYDTFYYQYSVTKKVFEQNKSYEKKNSGIFNPINMFLSNEIVLPSDGTRIEPKYYEAGKLRFGNANPESKDYYSLSDFYYRGSSFEIRIPWYLLNVVNPAEKMAIGDFYANKSVIFEKMNNMHIGAATISANSKEVKLAPCSFNGWNQSQYHMRIKKSYPIIKAGFSNIMSDYQ